MFKRKRKVISTPTIATKASPQTKKAVDFFNGKKSAVDMLQTDGTRKFHHSGYTKTIGDKFFELIEGKELWQSVALIATMIFVISVVLWGISQ